MDGWMEEEKRDGSNSDVTFLLPAEHLSERDDDYEDFSSSAADSPSLCSPGGIGQYTCLTGAKLHKQTVSMENVCTHSEESAFVQTLLLCHLSSSLLVFWGFSGFNCRVQKPRGPREPPAEWSRVER